MIKRRDIDDLESQWQHDRRWAGITRPYSADDVIRLRGSMRIEYSLARAGPNGSGTCCGPSRSSAP